MKKLILTIITSLTILSCNAQTKKTSLKLDKIPFDLKSGSIDKDTLKTDLNGDGKKDLLLQFNYEYDTKSKLPIGLSGNEIALFLNKGNNEFTLKAVNRAILWLIHTSIFGVDSKTFCVANEEGSQDPNNYYCYFQYDSKKGNWFLIRHEIFTQNTGKKVIIEQKVYSESEKIPFEIASFDVLFGKMHDDIPEPMIFKLILVPKSTLYKTPNTPTKMYLVKGNEVEVLEQKDNWLKVRYYGKKTIEGWVKKEDVE